MEEEKKFTDVIPPNEEHPADDVLPDAGTEAEGTETPETPEAAETPEAPMTDDRTEDVNPPAGCETPEEPAAAETPPAPAGADCLGQINGSLESIAGTEQRIFSEIREMHKLYHAEFAGRLKAMQDELDQYRKADKGRVYDDILASIARIYDNYEGLVNEVTEPKVKKSIRYMLMDMEDLLNAYGMEKLRSEPGDRRNPRHCQILNRITTDDPAKHDTVAKSYNSGFYIGNRTVMKEMVDIYLYEGQAPVSETEDNQIIEAGDDPVTE